MIDAPLSLHISLASGGALAGSVVLTNRSDSEIRIWRTGNSWGDEPLSFDVTSDGSVRHITRTPQVYTRNVPLFVSLEAGERYEIAFDLQDGSWLPAPDDRSRDAIRISASYDVPPSPEASTYRVWTGHLRGEP